MNWNIIAAVCVVGGVGLIFGLLLAFSAHIFAVKKDENAEKILSVLPGANCGSCGYAGCGAYAEGIEDCKAAAKFAGGAK